MNYTIIKRLSVSILLVLPAVFFSCGGCDNAVPYYTLNVQAVNGTVTVNPVQEKYREGTVVTLTAVPSDGYALNSWEGDTKSGENPLSLTMDGNKDINASFVVYYIADYHVDFNGGDDSRDGLTEATAWKHAPGDVNATGNAAACKLQPGNRILFRGNVIYRGNIKVPASGAAGYPIVYQGNAWPEGQKAIIDGGDIVTGWTVCTSADQCGGNPNYENIYYAYVPSGTDPLCLNLHEYNTVTSDDEFLWPAQNPEPSDPYFFDEYNDFMKIPQDDNDPDTEQPRYLNRTSIKDTVYFTQPDADYWEDSYLLVWVNPNIVVTRKILTYDPASSTVTFDDLGVNAMYPGGVDQWYAIYNSPHAITTAGEFFVSTKTDTNGRKILLWPRSTSDLDSRITYSVRSNGFDINVRSNITVEGFVVRKHAGVPLHGGVGIGTMAGAYMPKYNITVRDNFITHNRISGTGAGYGGIFLSNCYSSLVEGNEISYNPRHPGIFFGGGARITARKNVIIRSGGTSLRLYRIEHGIVDGNTISESNGGHANGITTYIASKDILVVNNRVLDSSSPITLQDSGNLWFINNLVDSCERESNVNEWGDTTRGPWQKGIVAFFNNTLVRNGRNAALNIGANPGEDVYYSINNIIDGGGDEKCVIRSHNLYTGLSWSQNSHYGWSLGLGEIHEENLSLIFTDPSDQDYSLLPDGPAAGTGRDITDLLPTDVFPEFDFSRDIDGKVRNGWDIGAYAVE